VGYRHAETVAVASAAAVAMMIGLGGCDLVSGHTLNSASLDSQIAAQLRARYPVDRVSVDCPKGVKESAGTTFSCTATIDGEQVPLTGTVESGSGRYSIAPSEAIIVNSQAAATLRSKIAAQVGQQVSVDCGPLTVRVVAVGGHFDCSATIPGQAARPVTVTVQDTEGNMAFSLVTG
jgi:hypothetical protein